MKAALSMLLLAVSESPVSTRRMTEPDGPGFKAERNGPETSGRMMADLTGVLSPARNHPPHFLAGATDELAEPELPQVDVHLAGRAWERNVHERSTGV
eukprot:1907946-Rhodomonas_salina.1